ncbi:MAG TPA: HNH endonuclease [Candidatus Babeliaceae bacterium]|nr:HNH endonuclease [Candidatus Babeliaceae bacterium]
MDEYLSTTQVKEILNCSEFTIRKYEHEGRLHAIRHAGNPKYKFFRPDEVAKITGDLDQVLINNNKITETIPIDKRNYKAISKQLRYFILQRDNFKCCACGRTTQEDGVKLEIDHKISRSRGGITVPDNLWTLCRDCNQGKSNFDLSA